MMKFVFHEREDLPRSAWCAVIYKNRSDIHVYHGLALETGDDFFVEGVWDGDFDQHRFDQAELFCGSGGRLIKDEAEQVVFATPNHVSERLCSINCDNKLFISNSMPFALSLSGSDIDAQYHEYLHDLNSIMRGLSQYKQTIPLKDSRTMGLHYFCNLMADQDLHLRSEKKLPVNPFTSYEDYYQNMLNLLEKIKANAKADHRKMQYGIVTTISKGYDAVACAVLARKTGCNTAFTFAGPDKYTKDCGEDIASLLGYENIIKKSAVEYLNNQSLTEAEYVSSGELGSGIIFSAFDREFAGNIVLFGTRGDTFWNRLYTDYNDEFRFSPDYMNLTSHIENRLRVGYIFFPPVYFRASQWASIYAISNSPEMADYSIGTKYDRPIPRRIIEEAGGIPRGMFAQHKSGAGFTYTFDNLSNLKKKMSPRSYDSFVNYYKTHKRKGLTRIYVWPIYIRQTLPLFVNHFFKITGVNYKFKENVFKTFSPGATSYLFNWGVEEMKKRYQNVSLSESP